LKCIGPDLYVCNTKGTAWTLKTANSPTCAAGGSTPDFWKDPIGWVISVITQAWESMLGFVTGQFNLFLANLKNFQNNFMTQLAAFIQDPLKSLRNWLDGVYTTIASITGQIVDGIGKWYDDNLAGTIDTIQTTLTGVRDSVGGWWDGLGTWFDEQKIILQRGWDNTTNGIKTWFNDQVTILQRGWDNVSSDLKTWFNDQKVILQRGWDKVSADTKTWFNEQMVIMQRGWDKVTDDTRTWFNDQVGIFQTGIDKVHKDMDDWGKEINTGIHDFVYDTVPGIVENVIMGLIEGIPGLQTVLDFIQSLYNTLTGNYPKDPELNDIQTKEREARERLRLLFERK
jgi:hypothetical protein